MRLRQVALVAEQLAPVREQLFTLLGITTDYQDPGVGEFGLENSVMSIGDTFLEVVSPKQPNTAAGRLLANRGGDGGYMVLFQVDDIQVCRDHTEALKLRKVWNIDEPDVKAFHIHPKDMGAAIVSLDWMQPAEAWRWGGPGWQQHTARHALQITQVTLQAEAPEQLADHWATILQQPVAHKDNRSVITLADGEVIFVPVTDGRGSGVAGLTMAVGDLQPVQDAANSLGLVWHGDQLQVCGTWLRFEAAL